MYTPNFISLLCLVVAVLWTTAGFTLLLYSGRSHSRPDYMTGIGLLIGGVLAGLCSAPIAGQGVFPLESLILGLCFLWCFGFGEPDEATALQVGDKWAPALAMGALATLAFLLVGNVGGQPVLWIGAEIRPFELVVAGLFGYLLHRSLALPESFFYHLSRRHVRLLVVTCLGASLAGLFGGPHADLGRFLILAIGPIPFLLVGIQGRRLARVLAVTLSMALAFLSLTHAFHMRANRTALETVQRSVVDLALHYSELHEPVQQAMASRAYQEPKTHYGELLETVRRDLAALNGAAPSIPEPDLRPTLQQFSHALTSHRRWSGELFDAIEAGDAAGGSARIQSTHQEARLAYTRGNSALAGLQQDLISSYGLLGTDTEQLASFVLALLAAMAMLGFALLRSESSNRAPLQLLYVPLDPAEDGPRPAPPAAEPPVEVHLHR